MPRSLGSASLFPTSLLNSSYGSSMDVSIDSVITSNSGRLGASLVAQRVKNLPAMQETLVWCLGQEDPLEKGIATHFSIFAWEIPWTEEPGGATVHGVTESDTIERLNTHRQVDFIIMVLIFLFLRWIHNSSNHKGGKLCNQPWGFLLFYFCNMDNIWDGEDIKQIYTAQPGIIWPLMGIVL